MSQADLLLRGPKSVSPRQAWEEEAFELRIDRAISYVAYVS